MRTSGPGASISIDQQMVRNEQTKLFMEAGEVESDAATMFLGESPKKSGEGGCNARIWDSSQE